MTGSQALHNTIDLAQLTDALGYHRYWVAEHHGGPMLAGPSPEALIGPIASATERIRVGSGGVMLPHYSPFKVAETFSVLAGLYPGRIDLGLGRAAGTDPMTTHALQRDRSKALPDDFPEQLAELLAYFEGTIPISSPLARLAEDPARAARRRPSRGCSAPRRRARSGPARLGLPYAFADFINSNGAEIAALYRRGFADGVRLDAPRTAVAVWALAADTEEEAQRLATSSRMAFTMLRRGRLIAVPPPDVAERFLAAEGDGLSIRRRTIVGTPAQVRAGIEEAAAEYGAEEVIVVTITHDHGARRRSYELIAGEFGLSGADDLRHAEAR